MSTIQSQAAPLTLPEGRPAERTAVDTALTHCLVVAADPQRCEMIARVAAANGWETVLCHDAATALSCLERMFVQLAVLDLERHSARSQTELHRLAEELAAAGGLLLVICGNPASDHDEMWARQLGPWLYLPGVRSEGLALACADARQVVEQLAQATREALLMPAKPNRF